MRKIYFLILFMFIFCIPTSSQRIVFESDFETIQLHLPDSLPNGWAKYDVDQINPAIGWAVRDTACNFGGNTRPRAIGAKSLEIPWYAGNGGSFINDDWVFTDSFTVMNGDSLIFSMLIGNDSTFQYYTDSMQVYVCFDQAPGAIIQKLATIIATDSVNDWKVHKFDLNSFNGQFVFIAFRFYCNVSVNGLWCNIDNLFIGNHSTIGIQPISNEIPRQFNLKQNYPNPFNPVTNIEFDIAKTSYVKLEIYNSIGQEVKTLVNEELTAGSYRVDFNASGLPSGAYFYRLVTDSYVKTNKMILVK